MISVIIPVFNRNWSVTRALESASSFLENLNNGEIIIINDGSTDNSLEIINNFINTNSSSKSLIKVISYQENRGVCHARNLGVTKAKNDWILFLDSDDELLSGVGFSLEAFLGYLDGASLHFFGCINENGENVGKKLPGSNKITFNDLVLNGTRGESLPILKRSLILKHPYDEDLRGVEGLTYLKIVKEIGHAMIHDYPLRRYFSSHNDRLSSKKQMLNRSKDIFVGYKRMLNLFYKDLSYLSCSLLILKLLNSFIRYRITSIINKNS
jgi:glycosyltransferase involved in cell wall biosynthesis